MEAGWIRLHRRLRDHWLWPTDRPYSKLEAWIDLMLLANHKESQTLVGSRLMTLGRGQHLTSQVKLAEKWGWNRETVSNFLRLLQKEKMANIQTSKQASTGYTLITIENYDKYQSNDSDDPASKPASSRQQNQHKQ